MEVAWNDSAIYPKLPISFAQSKDYTINANNSGKHEVSDESAVSELTLTGYYTKISEKAYIPSKKILKADNFKKLLSDNFSYMISWENSVGNHLSQVIFPDKKKTNHIQDGICDFDMLSALISSYNHMSKPDDALIISGNAGDEKYQLVWAQIEPRDLALTESRNINNDLQNANVPAVKLREIVYSLSSIGGW